MHIWYSELLSDLVVPQIVPAFAGAVPATADLPNLSHRPGDPDPASAVDVVAVVAVDAVVVVAVVVVVAAAVVAAVVVVGPAGHVASE